MIIFLLTVILFSVVAICYSLIILLMMGCDFVITQGVWYSSSVLMK